MIADDDTKRWAAAWVSLALAVALHVADEALSGFLPFYNSLIESVREEYPWVPFPTFTFPVWISGLCLLVLVLLALTPLVLRGLRWLRIASYGLGILMVVNAIGHLSASIWLGDWAPGVYSSPVLLLAAIALLVMVRRAQRGSTCHGSGQNPP